jgi:signal transduction histidine kinase
MTWRRRVLIAAPVVAFVATWPFLEGSGFSSDPVASVTDAVTGLILVAAGLVTWSRRPDGRTGPWLVVAGYLWYVGDLYFVFPSMSIVPLLSFGLRGGYDILIAAALLTFPGSRLSRSLHRAVVGAVAVAWTARAVAFLATARPGFAYPNNGTPNPFLIVTDGSVARNLDLDVTMLKGVLILAVGLLALARMRSVPGPSRRVLRPVVAGGLVWAAMTFLISLGQLVDANWHVQLLPWARGDWWAVPEYLLRGSAAPIGFLAGAMLLRTARSAVVDLVRGFEASPLRSQLEASLRRALGEASLRVLYPDRAGPGWVDGSGAAAGLPEPGSRLATTPIVSSGVTRAAIVHDAGLLEDPGLVSAVAATVRLAVDNEHLAGALEAQLEETRASRRRIVEAGDNERQRIERDLHDGAQQRLVSLAISLRMLGESLGDDISKDVRDELAAASAELRDAIEDLRELAHGLDPAILRESGLGPAIRSLVERSPTETTLELELGGRMPRAIEATAYFVVAEALANSAKHAAATRVSVRARADHGALLIEVVDNGVGGAEASRGSGLRGLADRVAAAGGTLDLTSATGGGTRVTAELPMPA